MPNGDDSEPPAVSSCDIIRITGKPENCDAAKQALIDNVPITIEVFHVHTLVYILHQLCFFVLHPLQAHFLFFISYRKENKKIVFIS